MERLLRRVTVRLLLASSALWLAEACRVTGEQTLADDSDPGNTDGSGSMPTGSMPTGSTMSSSGDPTTSTEAPAAGSSTSSDGSTANAESSGAAPLDPCLSLLDIRVASFNIRFDNGGPASQTATNGWLNGSEPRRDMVIALVQEIDPDLLGVQEALANQVDDLVAAFPEFRFVGVGRDDGVRAGEFAGIFYRPDRFELLQQGYFWLSTTPEIPGTVFENSGSIRMATWIIVRDIASNREVFVLNTHWDNQDQTSRELSALLIRERLGSLGAGRPTIMTGDLNANESNVAVQALLAAEPADTPRLIDGFRQVVPESQGDELTFHNFTGGTTGERIDYVLHTDPFLTDAATIHRNDFSARFPSDHYPVSSNVAWAECAFEQASSRDSPL